MMGGYSNSAETSFCVLTHRGWLTDRNGFIRYFDLPHEAFEVMTPGAQLISIRRMASNNSQKRRLSLPEDRL
jgi:hypothetical protein